MEKDSQLPKRIIDLLQDVRKNLETLLRSYFNHYQLSIPQISLIVLLQEHDELSISDISKKMGLSKSTVSGIIDRLERINIVERKRSAYDRRIVSISLVDQHKQIAEIIEQKFRDFIFQTFHGVPEQDLIDIYTGLTKFNQIVRDNMELVIYPEQ